MNPRKAILHTTERKPRDPPKTKHKHFTVFSLTLNGVAVILSDIIAAAMSTTPTNIVGLSRAVLMAIVPPLKIVKLYKKINISKYIHYNNLVNTYIA